MSRKKETILYTVIAAAIIVIAASYFVGWSRPVNAPAGVSPAEVKGPQGPAGPAGPNVTAQTRTYDISADNGAFMPSTIAVNEGDTIRINFTAINKAYDITISGYGLHQTAAKGATKSFQFQANKPGKFAYYCESCGGLSSSATGSLLVIPRATSTPPAS